MGQGRDTEKNIKHPPRIGWKHLVLVCLASLILLSVSGIGGIGYQDTDWLKHNTILKELVARPWPYSSGRRPGFYPGLLPGILSAGSFTRQAERLDAG